MIPPQNESGNADLAVNGPLRRWTARVGGLAPVAIYGVTILSTLVGGVILARFLSLGDRGTVAIMSVAASLTVSFCGAGLPEYVLRLGALRRPSLGLSLLVVLAVVIISIFTMVVATSQAATLCEALLFATFTVWSLVNSFLLAWAQITRGLVLTLLVQSFHSLAVGSALLIAGLSVKEFSVLTVLITWVSIEMLTCTILLLLIGPKTAMARREPFVFSDLRHSSSHLAAQLGAFLGDRGLVLVSSIFGGQGGAASMAVAQSSTSPILVPIQAFAPRLLSRPGVTRNQGRLVLILVTTIGALALVLLPSAIRLVFGPQYDALSRWGSLLAAAGVLLAAWRSLNLRLRSRGLGYRAVIADAAALAAFLVAASMAFRNSQFAGVAVGLTAYAVAGSLTAFIIFIVDRRATRLGAR